MDSLANLPERPSQKTQQEEAIMSQFFDDPQRQQRPQENYQDRNPQQGGQYNPPQGGQGGQQGNPQQGGGQYNPQQGGQGGQYNPQQGGGQDANGQFNPRDGRFLSNDELSAIDAQLREKGGSKSGMWKLAGVAIILFIVIANTYTGGFLSKLPKMGDSYALSFSVQAGLFAILLAIATYFLSK